ncbi:DUF3775 domain-containing protein [Bradyrhizobium vignae]|uniref:DUF3775 domain-containing protein n=1 Tax=Bradyrhizobium vignae TaxID=1549949 RepID=A0ABS4A4R2_9BRAD|nr:DUF3775 domain-containing protein [Bradyrhizobium vignae]RXG83828.1 DUF3775 domain-containing protein [Bradyrhizobium vignae]
MILRNSQVCLGSKCCRPGGGVVPAAEQGELDALTWLGRGDGDLSDWRELRAQAAQAHNQRTASYPIGTPMPADYLEEAMTQFGKSFEEFGEQL